MKATLVNFRRGKRTMKGNEMIAMPETDKETKTLIGKKVVYKTAAGKELVGVVAGTHGNGKAIRLRFNRGMPGQAVGHKVEILE